MNAGEIVLLTYPFADLTGSKTRPALIVSGAAYNRAEDLVFVPISSVANPSDPFTYGIEFSHPAFSSSGLKRPSWVKWSKPFTLSRRVAQRRLGRLDAQTLAEIQSRIRDIFQS